MLQPETLPAVLAGPLLRRLEPGRLVLWLVGSRALALTLRLQFSQDQHPCVLDIELDATRCQVIPVGRAAFIHLIDVPLATPLPQDVPISYDLLINGPRTCCTQVPRPRISSCTAVSTSCCTALAANRTITPMKACFVPIACWPQTAAWPSAQPC